MNILCTSSRSFWCDFQAIMTTTLPMLKAGLSSCARWGFSLFITAMQKCSVLNKRKTGFALLALMTSRPACFGQSTLMSLSGSFEYIQIWCILCALYWAHVHGVAFVKDTQAMAWMLRKLSVAAVQRVLLFFLHISLMLPNRPFSNVQTSILYSQVCKYQFSFWGLLDSLVFCKVKM